MGHQFSRSAALCTSRIRQPLRLLAVLAGMVVGAAGCVSRSPADPARFSAAATFAEGAITWPQQPEGWSDTRIAASDEPRRIWFTIANMKGGALATSFYSIRVKLTKVTPRGLGLLAEAEAPATTRRPRLYSRVTPWFFFSGRSPSFPIALFDGPAVKGEKIEAERICPVHVWLREPAGGPARGLVVALLSLGDSRYEDAVIDELNRRGWAVLGSPYPFGLEFMFGPSLEGPYTTEAFAREIAARLDSRLAEWAYGCEAVLEELAETRPELAQRPMVILGFSAGALGAPAVAARLHGRVDAAVLIGGGADMLRIIHTSHLFRNAAQVRWEEGPIAPEVLDELSGHYLAASRLDPYHTAAALARVPVLQLHALKDRIVPAPTGDLLHERLGRPERWSFNVGHELLFWRLPAYAGDIADWIEEAVRGAAESAAPDPVSGRWRPAPPAYDSGPFQNPERKDPTYGIASPQDQRHRRRQHRR